MANAAVAPWPATGFVGIRQLLGRHGGPIPLSPSAWWAGVKAGRFPAPIKVAGRTVWRVRDIDALIARLDEGDGRGSTRGRPGKGAAASEGAGGVR